MKNTLFFIVSFFSIIAYAQDEVYGKPEILLDKEVKIIPRPQNHFDQKYRHFYHDEKMYDNYKGKHVINKEHLENRVFKVTEVYKLPKPVYDEIYYRIKLEDVATKELVYFKYNTAMEKHGEYYFEVVGGLIYPSGFFCDQVIKRESTLSKTYTTTKDYVGTFLEKTIDTKTNKEAYTLFLSFKEVKEPVKKQGLVITFDNGNKIDLPREMFIYERQKYTLPLELTPAHLQLLTTQTISKIEIGGVKMYKYDKGFFLIQEMLKCMLTMK